MKIEFAENYQEMSERAADSIIHQIQQKENLLLCASTGNSPRAAYQLLSQRKNEFDISKARVVKLDEWILPKEDYVYSCEHFLQEYLIAPMQISGERYTGFRYDTKTPEKEIASIQHFFNNADPIDICILGIGKNGHIALNEPSDILTPHCHMAKLSDKSMQHQMISDMKAKPHYGLTLGMADILRSKTILMLVSGKNKQMVINEFLSEKITTQLPASFLHLHPNVHCIIDKEAMQ